jgi:hypothetical protein
MGCILNLFQRLASLKQNQEVDSSFTTENKLQNDCTAAEAPTCQISCGSGFPAAIRTAVAKEIRGWKAAPTVNKLLTLRTIGFFHCYRIIKKFLTLFRDHYTSLYLSV